MFCFSVKSNKHSNFYISYFVYFDYILITIVQELFYILCEAWQICYQDFQCSIMLLQIIV